MSKFTGMTTLDRLVAAGKLADFEAAVAIGARDTALKILKSVDLNEAQANAVYEGAMALKREHGGGLA